MAAHEFYLFRVRDPISDKWGKTRYKIIDQTAHERGEGNYEPIVNTREVRTGYVPFAFGRLVEKLRAAVFAEAADARRADAGLYRSCRRAGLIMQNSPCRD
jgi:hypothetical protein